MTFTASWNCRYPTLPIKKERRSRFTMNRLYKELITRGSSSIHQLNLKISGSIFLHSRNCRLMLLSSACFLFLNWCWHGHRTRKIYVCSTTHNFCQHKWYTQRGSNPHRPLGHWLKASYSATRVPDALNWCAERDSNPRLSD